MFATPLGVVNAIVRKHAGDAATRLRKLEAHVAGLEAKLDAIHESLHTMQDMMEALAASSRQQRDDADDAIILLDG